MTETTRTWPDIAIPPGEVIVETIGAIGLSQAELARRMGRPAQAVNEIVRGTKQITPETALQLERVLGVPAHVWARLEADYRYNKARLADRERLEAEKEPAAQFPYPAMSRLGWVARTRDHLEQVRELLKFFGVASLSMVSQFESAAYRTAQTRPSSPEALAAWIRQGERLAQAVPTDTFDVSKLRSLLPRLREQTAEHVRTFEPEVRRALAHSGIAWVLVPHLPKTYAHGATFWIRKDRAVVQMSIRYKWDDIFWFSFFHELGHILLHGRDVFIEYHNGSRGVKEAEADDFAAELLLPSAVYEEFVEQTTAFSKKAVVSFAREQRITPSIIVGRLQHEGRLPHSHLNGLRRKFEWAT